MPADQKQALLSKGISEAMNNTAFGLGIAVTCIIFHLFLTAYAKRMIEVVELNALKLENLLSRRSAGETVGDGLREARPEGAARPTEPMAFYFSQAEAPARRG